MQAVAVGASVGTLGTDRLGQQTVQMIALYDEILSLRLWVRFKLEPLSWRKVS